MCKMIKHYYQKDKPLDPKLILVPVPNNHKTRSRYWGIRFGYEDMQPSRELAEFANDMSFVTRAGKPGMTLFDSRHIEDDMWPGHSNQGRDINTERAFRKELKRMAKCMPNGIVMMVYSGWERDVGGTFLPTMMVGKVTSKLSVEDSRNMVHKMQDEWYARLRESNRDRQLSAPEGNDDE